MAKNGNLSDLVNDLRELSKTSRTLRDFLTKSPQKFFLWIYEISISLGMLSVALIMSGKGFKFPLDNPLISGVALVLLVISCRLLDLGTISFLNLKRYRIIKELKGSKVGESMILGLIEEGQLEDVPPSLSEEELKPLEERHRKTLLRSWILSFVLIMIAIGLIFMT